MMKFMKDFGNERDMDVANKKVAYFAMVAGFDKYEGILGVKLAMLGIMPIGPFHRVDRMKDVVDYLAHEYLSVERNEGRESVGPDVPELSFEESAQEQVKRCGDVFEGGLAELFGSSSRNDEDTERIEEIMVCVVGVAPGDANGEGESWRGFDAFDGLENERGGEYATSFNLVQGMTER
jgi:hypothetical protein